MSKFTQRALMASICMTLFFDAIGSGLIYPILPQLFLNKYVGFTIDESLVSRELLYSISLALFPLTSIFGMPILGSISDKYGRKNVIYYGIILLALSYLVGAIAVTYRSVWLFLLVRVVVGFLAGTYSVANALVCDLSSNDEERVNNFQLPVLASVLGFIIGPGISILVRHEHVLSLALPFFMAFLLGIVNIFLLGVAFKGYRETVQAMPNLDPATKLNVIVESEPIVVKEHTNIFRRTFYDLIFIFINPQVRLLSYSYFFMQFGVGLFLQSLSLYLAYTFSCQPEQIGYFFIVTSIFFVAGMFIFQRLLNKYINYITQVKLALIVGVIIFIIRMLADWYYGSGMKIAHLDLVWLTCIFVNFVFPLLSIGYNTLFSKAGGALYQGRLMGGCGQLASVARFTSGMLVGSLILHNRSLTFAVVVLALVASFYLLTYYLAVNKEEEQSFA
jgi:MFS family permease